MTIPRLTRFGRISHTSHVYVIRMMRKDKAPLLKNRISLPSPAEKRKARHQAYRRAQRKDAKQDRADLHIVYLMGLGDRPSLPPSRGTTHGQLMQMYNESEQP